MSNSKSLQLNCFDPFDSKKPHKLQQTLLSLELKGSDIHFYDIVAGRGSGKSVGVILLLIKLSLEQKLTILVLSPTYRKLKDNILSIWKEIVPVELYRYNSTESIITLINGSQILLRSRSIDNAAKGEDATRGLSVNIVIDDEAAEGFSKKQYTTTINCCRKPGPRAYITTTTPVLNEYSEVVKGKGHKLFNFASGTNPFLPNDFVETAKREMSPQEFDREINGNFTSLGGQVWSTFSESFYPAGNMIPYEFDHFKPYTLSMDIGSASASMVLWQETYIDGQNRFIAFAEYHGKRSEDNSVQRLLQKASVDYGTPGKIVVGNDMVARSSVDGQTGVYMARQIFGAVPVVMPTGAQRSKEIQLDCSNALILNGSGQRRLLVSSTLKSYDPSNRGLLPMFRSYAFPEKPLKGEIFRKDGHFEHCCDVLLYACAACFNPPRFVQTNFLDQQQPQSFQRY
jgi:hypothetical protein